MDSFCPNDFSERWNVENLLHDLSAYSQGLSPLEESAAFRCHVPPEGVVTCHKRRSADGLGVLSPLTPTTAWMIITVLPNGSVRRSKHKQ